MEVDNELIASLVNEYKLAIGDEIKTAHHDKDKDQLDDFMSQIEILDLLMVCKKIHL
jgi:hypothetical protein